ncbi:type II secretion system minor pseudopilin GspI [Pseudomonas cannabina]|uniref:Type II secretion system protein I n=1 Tax=Pseudomonas cannabina TaxID=86840 RepID=A0A0N8QXP8_PSECA|nr:type II secretion system minor pseudopilin GspI [Pseudomonas cannabina]KAA8716020.1 type II secretion system protein GspI [Pseudomonas cannabina]KPW73390.1 proteinral secretion pathway protein I [Pseudomonas cannabina]RMN23758.1 proteinral secretion pathway protein I [Pseudomonas cannabina]SDQ81996.1 type II secretion system protein I (GspI) [Pseudomonas cannabina]
MYMPHKEHGFTLTEVLVALAIIAIALAAAARVSGVMTHSNGLLRDRALALLAAQNQLAELRMAEHLAAGTRAFECNQGRLLLRCEQSLTVSADGRLMRVSLKVSQRDVQAPPLARLDTLLGRPAANRP